MEYSKTLSLDCPYCKTKTQFVSDMSKISFCKNENRFHDLFICTNCGGLIVTRWDKNTVNIQYGSISSFRSHAESNRGAILEKYYPVVGDFISQIGLSKITSEDVKKDFKEAMDCYNNGFYNASMVMSRRAIHQEMDIKQVKGDNLYKKIDSLDISKKLKELLQKVKNFGNSGAHPDYFLYDDKSEKLIKEENEKEFARLALIFLDKYFQDQYELEDLIGSAPKSEKEK